MPRRQLFRRSAQPRFSEKTNGVEEEEHQTTMGIPDYMRLQGPSFFRDLATKMSNERVARLLTSLTGRNSWSPRLACDRGTVRPATTR
jgi:hypothetical protein